MSEVRLDQDVLDRRVRRLRENAKFYARAQQELENLMGEQDAAQWSAASPVGAYLKTLGTALAQLQSGLVAMHDTVEAQAEALEGTAAHLTAQDEAVADSLSAVAARSGY
ncbi:hypothetical protein [Cellulomonas soli]|uniref:Uncharacterized protein n=1 Tax=Cellulomonas soli TaxID=931535 RepID=A0A512PIV2_9CELL|nr:hypothetical protein [Cellulomonas soli]NYI58828.1 hypothetical protein [Cellulomonas soli]GEP71130.1 hypothetical protein CSO01_38450 [Cellulomonas soli]